MKQEISLIRNIVFAIAQVKNKQNTYYLLYLFAFKLSAIL